MYAVDLEQLDVTVGEMTRCGDALDDLLDEVSHRVADLHLTWSGSAALAQEAAQAEWEAGFRRMRAGLAAMRTAGEVAHDSYRDGAETNVRMWGQVS